MPLCRVFKPSKVIFQGSTVGYTEKMGVDMYHSIHCTMNPVHCTLLYSSFSLFENSLIHEGQNCHLCHIVWLWPRYLPILCQCTWGHKQGGTREVGGTRKETATSSWLESSIDLVQGVENANLYSIQTMGIIFIYSSYVQPITVLFLRVVLIGSIFHMKQTLCQPPMHWGISAWRRKHQMLMTLAITQPLKPQVSI